MVNLFGILLAIIFYIPSSLHAYVLAKHERPFLIDTHEQITDLPISRGNLWLEADDQIGYLRDYVGNVKESPRSRLLSSLTDNSKGLGKSQHAEIQSSRQSQSQEAIPIVKWQQQESEEQEDCASCEEEYGEQEEEEHQKSGIDLFGSPRPEPRENLEQFQHEHHRMVSGAMMINDDIRISRVDRPATIHFSYLHPEEWSLDSPECSGRLQSPVNLDSGNFVSLDVPSSLIWTGYWNRPRSLTITDNGHSVELGGTWDENTTPFISEGPLKGEYLFAQLHFHWGPKDSVGSEHTINNNSFPMEMHMVHYKRDYETLQGAQSYDDGLAVIAFLFEISETPNVGIGLLEDSLSKIQNNPKVRIPVKHYPLAGLDFIFHEGYASYIGSLTTPPCRQVVTWLVSSSPLTISHKQLEAFRKISNKWPAKQNYRQRQALNGRRLYYVAH